MALFNLYTIPIMNISILTYNVLFNQAALRLVSVLKREQPDIFCFQEIDTNEDNLQQLEFGPYRLADYSNSFVKHDKIYGVATYYNARKFQHVDTDILQLPKSIYEVIVTISRFLRGGNKPRTALCTEFIQKKSGKKITIYNTHLTSYGSNNIRQKQIDSFLREINPTTKNPILIVGDFNHLPYQRKKLEVLFRKYRLSEATKNLPFTFTYDFDKQDLPRIMKTVARLFVRLIPEQIKIDYVLYRHLKLEQTKRIDIDYSDHFPIISKFK